ncbi:hypothetical protein ACLOJK_015852 [Asimina triloba]
MEFMSLVMVPQNTRVDLLKDAIYVNGNRISKKLPPKLYFALNKPKGLDKRNPGLPKPRLFTVGRLDVATTGLIIVTNDGTVNRRHLVAVSEGTTIEGIHCIPDSVELLPAQPDVLRARLRIAVHEGRNHEVRELVKNAGLQMTKGDMGVEINKQQTEERIRDCAIEESWD